MNVRKSFPDNSVILIWLILSATLAILVGYLFRINVYDFMQHDADAAYFFEIASSGEFGFPIDDQIISNIIANENSAPILIWGWIYGLLKEFGVDPNPLWGIVLNASIVVVSQLITVFYARRVFQYDGKALVSLSLLMSLNGVMMMFAGIHMRDAFLLLTSTISVIIFHPQVTSQSFAVKLKKLFWLILLMVVSFLCRMEGFVVPILIYLISAFISLRANKLSVKFFILLTITIFAFAFFWLDGVSLVIDNYETYKLLTQGESKDSSLAYFLLYELPIPLSTIASSILLLFVKIPFWSNFFVDSYSFFISIAAIQMLFVAPVILAIIMYMLVRGVDFEHRYLIFIVLTFLILTSITSNQIRHLATVYPFLILLFTSRKNIILNDRKGYYSAFQYSIFSSIVILSIFMVFK